MHVRKGEERERDRETVEVMIIAPKIFLQIVEENRTVCLYPPVS
jgi:hypothetical protein